MRCPGDAASTPSLSLSLTTLSLGHFSRKTQLALIVVTNDRLLRERDYDRKNLVLTGLGGRREVKHDTDLSRLLLTSHNIGPAEFKHFFIRNY